MLWSLGGVDHFVRATMRLGVFMLHKWFKAILTGLQESLLGGEGHVASLQQKHGGAIYTKLGELFG